MMARVLGTLRQLNLLLHTSALASITKQFLKEKLGQIKLSIQSSWNLSKIGWEAEGILRKEKSSVSIPRKKGWGFPDAALGETSQRVDTCAWWLSLALRARGVGPLVWMPKAVPSITLPPSSPGLPTKVSCGHSRFLNLFPQNIKDVFLACEYAAGSHSWKIFPSDRKTVPAFLPGSHTARTEEWKHPKSCGYWDGSYVGRDLVLGWELNSRTK